MDDLERKLDGIKTTKEKNEEIRISLELVNILKGKQLSIQQSETILKMTLDIIKIQCHISN